MSELNELIQRGYIGNPAQAVTLRRMRIEEGRAKGTDVIEVGTMGGLQLDILPDTGLDIGRALFKGVPVAWMSKNGYDSLAAFNAHETEFVNTFPGGLLFTCGLRSAGPANRDGDEWHPLHGRYHAIPAEHVCAEISGDEIVVKGVVRETALFGHVLEVHREIRIPIAGAKVTVTDTLVNQSPRAEAFMQVYHCNFGYPLLSEHARLILPEARRTLPRTEFAKTGLGRECEFDAPIPGEEERVFFQIMERDFRATLKNPALGIAMTMTWSGATLPILSQWRSMAAGDYVLGLEPTNCYIMGRSAERENGTLPMLEAFASEIHTVTIAFEEEN